MHSSWPDLHARRLAWAADARTDLVREIEDDDVRLLYERAPDSDASGEARVAVLGPTQVGKTTVILRLLRLTPAGEETVARVLRGGRAKGRSASATAAIYSASPDDLFRCREGPGAPEEALVEADLLGRLAGLRGRMEAGAFGETDAVLIAFPRMCFAGDTPPALRVIDLPGLDARSEEERLLTTAIVDRYLPLATLGLLVERADNLSALGFLTVPGAGDGWLAFPERYAIVLTRAVAARSVQTDIRAGRIPSLAALTATYKEEFVRSLFPVDGGGRTSDEQAATVEALDVFPLDLGDSRATLPADVLGAAVGMLDDSEAALLDRVRRASEPAGALVLTARLHRAASDLLRQVERAHAHRVGGLETEIARATDAYEGLERKRVRHQQAAKSLEKEIIEASALPAPGHYRSAVDGQAAAGSRDRLKSYIGTHDERCQAMARRAASEMSDLGLPPPDDLSRLAAGAFDHHVGWMRGRLNSYGVDFYAFWNWGAAVRDAREARECAERGVNGVDDMLRETVKHAHDVHNEGVKARIRDEEKLAEAVLVGLHREEQGRRRLEEDRDRAEAATRERCARIERDVEIGKTFQRFLRQRYRDEHARSAARLAAAELTDAERLHALAYLHLIADVYRRLGDRVGTA